jgi:hypothetical protein
MGECWCKRAKKNKQKDGEMRTGHEPRVGHPGEARREERHRLGGVEGPPGAFGERSRAHDVAARHE